MAESSLPLETSRGEAEIAGATRAYQRRDHAGHIGVEDTFCYQRGKPENQANRKPARSAVSSQKA